jgi:hypothetical protein
MTPSKVAPPVMSASLAARTTRLCSPCLGASLPRGAWLAVCPTTGSTSSAACASSSRRWRSSLTQGTTVDERLTVVERAVHRALLDALYERELARQRP